MQQCIEREKCIEGRIDLESTPGVESTEADPPRVLNLLEEDGADQEAAQNEEDVDADPSACVPEGQQRANGRGSRRVVRKVPADDERDGQDAYRVQPGNTRRT